MLRLLVWVGQCEREPLADTDGASFFGDAGEPRRGNDPPQFGGMLGRVGGVSTQGVGCCQPPVHNRSPTR